MDRALLDVAAAAGAPYGGWCPAGGWAEDLPDPPGLVARYPMLRPTPSADPAQRTAWNVRDSDVTVVLRPDGDRSPGTDLTTREAERLGRPVLTCTLTDAPDRGAGPQAEDTRRWLREWAIEIGRPLVVNVAGPRESEAPGAYAAARDYLRALL